MKRLLLVAVALLCAVSGFAQQQIIVTATLSTYAGAHVSAVSSLNGAHSTDATIGSSGVFSLRLTQSEQYILFVGNANGFASFSAYYYPPNKATDDITSLLASALPPAGGPGGTVYTGAGPVSVSGSVISIAPATESAPGTMSAADKLKVDIGLSSPVLVGTQFAAFNMTNGSVADSTSNANGSMTAGAGGAPTYSANDHGFTFAANQVNAITPSFNVPLANGTSLGTIEMVFFQNPSTYYQSTTSGGAIGSKKNGLLGPGNAYNSVDANGNGEFTFWYDLGSPLRIYSGAGGGQSMFATVPFQAGLNTLTYTCTAAGPGNIILNGYDVTPAAGGIPDCTKNAVSTQAGGYQLGSGPTTNSSFYGKFYSVNFYTLANALTVQQAISNQRSLLAAFANSGIGSRLLPGLPVVGPSYAIQGTSIDASVNSGTTCSLNTPDGYGSYNCAGTWLNGVFPASQTRNNFNYSIYGGAIGAMLASIPATLFPLAAGVKAAGSNIPLIIGAPSNDLGTTTTAAAAWQSVQQMVNMALDKFKPIILVTSTSRGSGYDAGKDAYTPLVRQFFKAIGADAVIDINGLALVGADGAYSNASCYPNDQVHPSGCYAQMKAVAVSALAAYYGSTQSNPTTVTAATYAMADGDTYISLAPTANGQTATLPNCVGKVDVIYGVANLQSAFTGITLKTFSAAQTLNGIDYSATGLAVPANTVLRLRTVPNSAATGGCHLEM